MFYRQGSLSILESSCYINKSLHLARKYSRIRVSRYYQFRDERDFPRVKLEANCGLRYLQVHGAGRNSKKKFGKWKVFSLISWGKRWFLSIVYVSRTAKKLLVINSAFVIFPFVMKVFSEKRTKARCFYEIKERDLLLIASISCSTTRLYLPQVEAETQIKHIEEWRNLKRPSSEYQLIFQEKASFFNYGHRSWPFVVRLY